MKSYDISGQMHIFDFLSQDKPKEEEKPKEAPMLLHKGDKVYQVLRADIYTWIVDGRTWSYETKNDGPGRGYDLIDEEGLLHSTCWNSSLGSGFFSDYEEAVKERDLLYEIIKDEVLLAKDLEVESVKAYEYTFDDKRIIRYCALLTNNLVYLDTGCKFDHISSTDEGLKEFEDDKSQLKGNKYNLIELEDYEPKFKNMYKVSRKDNWLYAEARYHA